MWSRGMGFLPAGAACQRFQPEGCATPRDPPSVRKGTCRIPAASHPTRSSWRASTQPHRPSTWAPGASTCPASSVPRMSSATAGLPSSSPSRSTASTTRTGREFRRRPSSPRPRTSPIPPGTRRHSSRAGTFPTSRTCCPRAVTSCPPSSSWPAPWPSRTGYGCSAPSPRPWWSSPTRSPYTPAPPMPSSNPADGWRSSARATPTTASSTCGSSGSATVTTSSSWTPAVWASSGCPISSVISGGSTRTGSRGCCTTPAST